MKFEYTLNFETNSLNKTKHYNIYYDENIVANNISFPYTISFNKWQNYYNIVVENVECGSRKKYILNGQTTTINYTTQPFPTTNPIFVRPTTTTRLPETTSIITTTTVKPKFVKISSIIVNSCSESTNGIISNITLNFIGNYSNKLYLSIRNSITDEVIRRLDGGIITTNSITLNIPIGTYLFEIRDVEDEYFVTDFIPEVLINCPKPSFKIEYIPNNCGENNSKIRIFDIKSANKFRYCVEQSFVCDNNFDKPDAIVSLPTNEVYIETHSGQPIDYTHGQFITVRGFGFNEFDFTDVTVEITPCIKPATNDIIYFTTSYKNVKVDQNGNNVRITINLIQNGKKVVAPIDISVTGYYTISSNGSYIQQKFDTIVLQNTSSINIYKTLDTNSEIFDACIENIDPSEYKGIYFQNNSPCS